MVNFLLGAVAGGVIACVVTISAARHPYVQSRLGLMPAAHAAAIITPMSVSTAADRCATPNAAEHDAKATSTDKLFEPRRFWFVAP